MLHTLEYTHSYYGNKIRLL